MVCEGQQAQSLDEEFEKIFERYYRPVSYYFARRGFSADECHDLAQETFLRAYRRWDQCRKNQEKGWLFTIAANLYRNTIRHRRAAKRDVQKQSLSELADQGLEPPAEDDDPVSHLLEKQQNRLLVKAIEELPPRMRQCFLLRFNQGRKYKEIAQVMQISIQSVRSQLHQAKIRLRETVKNG